MQHTIVTTEVTYPCPDGFAMKARVSRPSGEGTFPGMVMTFEATGLHVEMQRLADETAEAGYVVIAPDLYARGNPILCFARLMKDLKAEKGRGVDDLLAARSWLCAQSFVDPEHIATMGFCLGGGFALVLAKTGLFKVAADFYGEPPQTLDGACPVVASYGTNDKVMTPHVPALQRELLRLNIPNDVKVYQNVGHSFMNTQPNALMGLLLKYAPVHGAYDPEAAGDAMTRMLGFLSEHV